MAVLLCVDDTLDGTCRFFGVDELDKATTYIHTTAIHYRAIGAADHIHELRILRVAAGVTITDDEGRRLPIPPTVVRTAADLDLV
jgi:hypothetical protein